MTSLLSAKFAQSAVRGWQSPIYRQHPSKADLIRDRIPTLDAQPTHMSEVIVIMRQGNWEIGGYERAVLLMARRISWSPSAPPSAAEMCRDADIAPSAWLRGSLAAACTSESGNMACWTGET